MVQIDGQAHVFGGYSNEQGAPFNDIWETDAEMWQELEPTGNRPSGRYYHAAAVDNDKMYVFFGADGQGGVHPDIWYYNPADSTWTQAPPGGGPNPRQNHSATSLGDGRIVVFGGREQYTFADASAWIYNTADGTWQPGSSLPAGARYAHGAVGVNGKVHVFGGVSLSGYENDFWVYDQVMVVHTG